MDENWVIERKKIENKNKNKNGYRKLDINK